MNPVSLVIPSCNVDNLRACVTALRHCNGAMSHARLIVIDDGLAIPRGSVLDDAIITYLAGVKPFVFARNVNIGIAAAGRDDVIIMNDDATMQSPNGIALLSEACAAHPECGLMSASTNGGTQWQNRRSTTGVRYEVRYDDVMVSFVCVFIPRATIDRLGPLDERFGLLADAVAGPRGYGCEDDDYCWRVRASGMRLGICDGVFVNHKRLSGTFHSDPSRPADVKIHEALFQKKWGRHPRNP